MEKNKLNIVTHLGLGDHIITNGIIREYAKTTDIVTYAKPHNLESVKFMYRDLANVIVLPTLTEFGNIYHFDVEERYLFVGLNNLNYASQDIIEKQFYNIAKINYNCKYDSFKIVRDLPKEMSLYTKLNLTDYVLIHSDEDRGYSVDISKIFVPNGRKVVYFNKSLAINIFDYLYLIENAKEVHVIESSFMHLIECYFSFTEKGKFYNHRYARKYLSIEAPYLKNNWIIYDN